MRVYALLEIGIALIGIAILFVVPWVSEIYTAHAGRGVSGMLPRGLLAGLCLLPPTVLMGATLPAMGRWIVFIGSLDAVRNSFPQPLP